MGQSQALPHFTSIPYSRLSGFSRSWLAAASDSDIRGLYEYKPADMEACRIAAERTLRFKRPWKELAAELEQSGRRYGVPNAALSRLSAVAEGRAVMVVTGQQVGYLGGPLYTFLKAYHTTRLAKEIENRIGIPVLPLFWLEGEDHDLAEVREACYLAASGELKSLRFIPEREISGYEVGRYGVDGKVQIAEMAAEIGDCDAEGLALLHAAYDAGTLSEGMGKLLARTLGPRGLLVVEGMDAALKRMAAPLWETVIHKGRELAQILEKRSAELREQGWSAVLNPTPDSFLFYLTDEDHVRKPISYDLEISSASGEHARIAKDKLLAITREQSEFISPKAALRPLYQDFVLPTAAYVAGPGELDYHSQVAPFYRELDVISPVLFPRLSATILDSRAVRTIGKAGFSIERLLAEERDALAKELLREQDEGKTAALFESTRTEIETLFATLKNDLAAIDPTLEGAAHSAAGKILFPLNELRQKAERALKQKHGTMLARLDKALASLKPEHKLSERVFCTGYYLAKFGAEKLLSALDELPEENAHRVAVIE